MKIALLGDIAPFGKNCLTRNAHRLNYFEEVINLLSKFDLVIGNLEAPFAVNEKPISGKSATIKSHPDNIALLSGLGITHVTLANNHIGDFGRKGYDRTKALLEAAGIGWFGTEGKQIRIKKLGEKIALLGFCSYNTNPSPISTGHPRGLNYLDVWDAMNILEKNKRDGFFSVLAVHSGQEHVHMPSSDDINLARGLAGVSNYIYYGHHPHVIQGHETLSGSLIYYSLGNFMFDDVYTPRDSTTPLIRLSEANKTGIIATVEISSNNVISSEIVPIYMGEKRMLVGKDVPGFDMQFYDTFLRSFGTSDYEKSRSAAIAEYIHSRRLLRDTKWYIRRLNFNSAGIFLKSKINARRYRTSISFKLPLLKRRP